MFLQHIHQITHLFTACTFWVNNDDKALSFLAGEDHLTLKKTCQFINILFNPLSMPGSSPMTLLLRLLFSLLSLTEDTQPPVCLCVNCKCYVCKRCLPSGCFCWGTVGIHENKMCGNDSMMSCQPEILPYLLTPRVRLSF